VLATASAAFGEASRVVVSAANALGVVHKHAGDFAAAEAAYARALAAAGQLADDPLTQAGLLHNLGGLAHSRGDAATGIPLAERGLALRTGALGPAHPDVARDDNALGALYHLAGRYADAGRSYRRALVVFEDCYGPDHFETAQACANLAVLYADQGQFAAGEATGRRALAILEALLGPGDAEVGLTVLNLAAAVAGQGRLAEAAALANHATTILAAALPVGHPHLDAARQALEQLRNQA
jgi:tetratricopeptide (TPR) repeat protein